MMKIVKHNLGWKTLSNFCCNLGTGHLVNGFNGKDMPFDPFVLKTFFQLGFGLTRAKYLDGFGIANNSNDLIVVFVELVSKFSVPLVL